jgi:hypothetical protein
VKALLKRADQEADGHDPAGTVQRRRKEPERGALIFTITHPTGFDSRTAFQALEDDDAPRSIPLHSLRARRLRAL